MASSRRLTTPGSTRSCEKTPAFRRGSSISVSGAFCLARSDGGADNEASQDLRSVPVLVPHTPLPIAQPSPYGIVEQIGGAIGPGPAPSAPRDPGLGHIGHVSPFLAHGRRHSATLYGKEPSAERLIPGPGGQRTIHSVLTTSAVESRKTNATGPGSTPSKRKRPRSSVSVVITVPERWSSTGMTRAGSI